MFSLMLDNTIMLTVCVTNIECLINKGTRLQIKYNLDVALCQLFIIALNSRMLEDIYVLHVHLYMCFD